MVCSIPRAICTRLREKATRPFYLVVEKILARHEHLREDWPVEGTTGYEFANLVGGLFVDPAGEAAFSRFYREFTRQRRAFEDIVRDCKIRIMDTEMASELNVLARDAGRIARSKPAHVRLHRQHPAAWRYGKSSPAFRSTAPISTGPTPSEADRRDIDWAIAQARRDEHAPDASVFDFLPRPAHGRPGRESRAAATAGKPSFASP